MYLDTTYLRHAGVPPETFGSKAEGIAELLKKVQGYSPQTVFHLGAWTFGYEEVWLTLAAALRTKVNSASLFCIFRINSSLFSLTRITRFIPTHINWGSISLLARPAEGSMSLRPTMGSDWATISSQDASPTKAVTLAFTYVCLHVVSPLIPTPFTSGRS